MTETTEKKKTTKPKKDDTKAKENEALQSALEMIASLKQEIDSLKKEKETVIVQAPENTLHKKVKCISLAHHCVNVFTEPNCKGRVFSFKEYGQIIQMRYDELLAVLAYYPKTMESGLIYICDKEVIEDNGLGEAYQHIYDKETMDMIELLRRECDAEFILGMSESLRDSTLIAVARNYKNGEKMDATALAILRDAGYDVVKMAEESKI